MPATGVRPPCDIGHCAGDRSGDRYAPEKRHRNIGYALTDKLGIAVGMGSGHTVGHSGREQ